MLQSLSEIDRASLAASDGQIGHIREAYFDDERWVVRYLVIDTGTWLAGRDVLISPYSVRQPIVPGQPIGVTLTREQVMLSPVIDTHQPVSRRHEREYLGYYAYPEYWSGGEMWSMSALPMLPPALPNRVETAEEAAEREAAVPDEDVHLRSSAHVAGYDIHAADGSIGHVKDFLFEDDSWAIRYLVVDTRNWWPGGKKVLLATRWIDRIDWTEKTVFTTLTREQVKASPEYPGTAAAVDRGYEERLHEAHDRPRYWD
jgi:hypothetical protein